MKRKLRVRRTQKCIALVCGKTPPTCVGLQTTPFHGCIIGPRMEIYETSGLPISMTPHLHQSSGYKKRKPRVLRAQKSIALFGAGTVLTSAGPQTIPFHLGQYRAGNGNMWNFGPTNLHGTTFARNQWLDQKEATGMEAQKCIALVGAETVLPVRGQKLPRFMRDSIEFGMEICEIYEILCVPIGMVPRFHKRNVHIKRKLRVWTTKNALL